MGSKLTRLEKSWILYDVANSAFVLMISTLIPIYFKNIANENGLAAYNSTAYFSYALSISTLIVAVLGPILGTVADNKGYKKPLFMIFLFLGAVSCVFLSVPSTWLLFLIIFIAARTGLSGSIIFYDSMINDVTCDDKIDEVSSLGYAWGYIGSCVPFILCLLLVLFSNSFGLTRGISLRISFVITAVWWIAITIPLLRNYRQIYYIDSNDISIKKGIIKLRVVFNEIKKNKHVLYFLIAFFFYIDGVYTIIEMATVYGRDVGLGDSSMLIALLVTQFVAFPCSIILGRLSKKINIRNMISVCIAAYVFVALFAVQLHSAVEFWFLACFVGVFQGAIQALSISYYARIIPKEKSSEYFGIYDIFGKGASFAGTIIMGVSTQIFGTSKAGVLSIALMLAAGLAIFRLSTPKNIE